MARAVLALSAGGLIFCILEVDPTTASPVVFALFFLLVFLMTGSGCAWVLLILFRAYLGEGGAAKNLPSVLRIATLVSGLITGLLLLRFFGWLTWWVAALLISAMLLMELTLRKVIR